MTKTGADQVARAVDCKRRPGDDFYAQPADTEQDGRQKHKDSARPLLCRAACGLPALRRFLGVHFPIPPSFMDCPLWRRPLRP